MRSEHLIAFALVFAAVGVITVASIAGMSQRPQAWVVRFGVFAIGTTLLAFAVLGHSVVHELANLAFSGKPSGPGVGGAETAVRLGLAVLALACLAVPGTWMDVIVGLVVVLAVAATRADYLHREKQLVCGSVAKDVTDEVRKQHKCKAPKPKVEGPKGNAIRVSLPKARLVAPALALAAGKVDVVAVVEERDADGHIATVARRYDVKTVAKVPASQLTGDVAVDIDPDTQQYDRFLADLTAAKALRLLPDR